MNDIRFYLGEAKHWLANTTRTQRDVALAIVVCVIFLIILL